MLDLLILLIIVLWLLGFITHIGGALIHLLLVLAAIVLLIRIIRGQPL